MQLSLYHAVSFKEDFRIPRSKKLLKLRKVESSKDFLAFYLKDWQVADFMPLFVYHGI